MKFSFDWRNITFFGLLNTTAVIGGLLYIYFIGLSWFHAAIFFGMLIATLMSITVGYHRLFAHRSFEAANWIKILSLIFGAGAFQESCLKWATEHRMHHHDVDGENDPYNIKKGFMWAHIGWILFQDDPEFTPPEDLANDRLVMWQHRNWILIGI